MSFFIFPWPSCHWVGCSSASKCIWAFCFCCYWGQALICGNLIGCMLLFQFSYIFEVRTVTDYIVNFVEDTMRYWEDIYFVLGWNVLHISVKFTWSITSVSFSVSLFSLCFHNLSSDESGELKSHTIIVRGTMCALSFSKVSFMNVGGLAFGA